MQRARLPGRAGKRAADEGALIKIWRKRFARSESESESELNERAKSNFVPLRSLSQPAVSRAAGPPRQLDGDGGDNDNDSRRRYYNNNNNNCAGRLHWKPLVGRFRRARDS